MKKATIILSGFILAAQLVQAQDTLKRREVNITSTFKPSLKEAAKININAAPPTQDTTTPRLQYNIPNQNLAFVFQPGSLKPLALAVDSGGGWSNDSYVKLGYGNFNTPFAQAGFSLGDGRTMGVNAYARHYSSEGKIRYQDFSHTRVDLTGYLQSGNMEYTGRVGGRRELYNKYGFEPKNLDVNEDSIKVRFQNWNVRFGFHNINSTELGISYAPSIAMQSFSDRLGTTETSTHIMLPLKKTLGTQFQADLALEANLARYKEKDKDRVNNNFFSFSPAVHYKSANLAIQAGVRPSWDNKAFRLFPNIMTEIATKDNRFAIQAGWTGYFRYSGYQYMADMNPWIWTPGQTFNSAIEERYGGFKGAVGDHFNYGAKVAYNTVKNQPLFINDMETGKSFLVVVEPEMNVLNIGGELGYTVGEKFSMITTASFNRFSTEVNEKAWGLIPVEFNSRVRLQVMKDLYVNGNLYAFDGPWALSKDGKKNLQGGIDLGAGMEFRVYRNIKLWMQFNNILNKEYQRWNQYPVYGLNFLGGLVFSFAQKN